VVPKTRLTPTIAISPHETEEERENQNEGDIGSTKNRRREPVQSWQLAAPGDEFTARMFAALNAMMLDMLAAVARKDYEDRRRRQAHGIVKARAAGAYRGRPEDKDRNAGIAGMLRSGMSWTAIQAATGCSRATIAKVRARA
jgi:DNA invertase Pin-like site-specific DNA recombinase